MSDWKSIRGKFRKSREKISRREELIAEKQDSMVGVARTATEMKMENTKTAGKGTSIKQSEVKRANVKIKKPSIHERLEINKRKIQEKQGKDKAERGADLGGWTGSMKC